MNETMTVKGLKDAKCALEIDLAALIDERVRQFSEQCGGLMPKSIIVDMPAREIQTLGGSGTQLIRLGPYSVRTDIPFW